jgi:hypothetical protein
MISILFKNNLNSTLALDANKFKIKFLLVLLDMGGKPNELFEMWPFGLVGKAIAHSEAQLLPELFAQVVPPSSQLIKGF